MTTASDLVALEERWREAAKTERDYYADALRACADDLAALRKSIQGEVAVAWLVDAEFVDAGKVRTISVGKSKPDASHWPKGTTFAPLYLHPAGE